MTASMVRKMRGLTIVLLVATVVAHVMFASSPLPLGGPNVVLGVLLVFTSLTYAFLRARAAHGQDIIQTVRALFDEFRPIIWVVGVAALMLAWMFVIHAVTDTFDYRPIRWWQIAMGVCILISVYIVVDNIRRASLVALAFILTTFASTLFGVAVSFIGNPFLTIWLNVATVLEKDLTIIIATSRVAGLAPDTVAFGYQLAVAIPIAFAALLYGAQGKGTATSRRNTYRAVVFIALMTMVTVMFLNGTRSVLLGVAVSAPLVLIPSILPTKMSGGNRLRALLVLPAIALWMVAFFNPVYTVNDAVAPVWDAARPVVAPAWGATASAADTVWDAAASTVTGIFGVDTWDAEDTDDIQTTEDAVSIFGLAVGMHSLTARVDIPILGYTIDGLSPVKEYQVQLRAEEGAGFGAPSDITASAELDGSLTFTWYAPVDSNVIGYQFRLREDGEDGGDGGDGEDGEDGETQWTNWMDYTPTLSNTDPIIYDLTAGTKILFQCRGLFAFGHVFDGLTPWQRYDAQLRMMDGRGYWGESPIISAFAGAPGITLSWHQTLPSSSVDKFQYRLRPWAYGAEWTEWQDFLPSLQGNVLDVRIDEAPPAAVEELAVAIDGDTVGPLDGTSPLTFEGIISESNIPLHGHWLHFLTKWKEYALQVRAWNLHGYGPEGRILPIRVNSAGSASFTWREARCPSYIEGYQYRLYRSGDRGWLPWRDFTPGHNALDVVARGEMALYESGRDFVVSGRIWQVTDDSARARMYMASTAFRYSLDNPLGTGRYTPNEWHLTDGLDALMAEHVLTQLPHNQLLYILVHFGFPGLALAVVFYFLVLRALFYSGRFIIRSGDMDLYFLVFAVTGAIIAYGIHGLFHDVGPFVIDWGHFVILGLAFSIQRIVVSRESGEESQQP